MSEAHSPKPFRVEGDTLFIEGTPKETKEAFFEEMEKRVKIVGEDEFRKVVKVKGSVAHFVATVFFGPEGKRLQDVVILVNKDRCILDGEDYTDLIPIFVRHEIAELWIYAKKGYSLFPHPESMGEEEQRNAAHRLALREHYRYAFEKGKADRFLEFFERATGRQVEADEEEKEAYQKAKAWFERKSQAKKG